MASSDASPSSAPPVGARWSLAVHGGAGAISREFDPARLEYLRDLRLALDAGSAILRSGGSALDACVAAVVALEDSPLFNAGVGSVLTAKGQHELDAGVMRGRDMAAGAVAGTRTVRNPVRLARKVLDASPHVLLVGDGAEAFASLHAADIERVDNSFFTTHARLKVHQDLMRQAEAMQAKHLADSAAGATLAPTSSPNPPFMITPVLDHSAEHVGQVRMEPIAMPAEKAEESSEAEQAARLAEGHAREKKYGTVGAVALDMHGDLATAISTGGMSMKSYGRVGDSPVVGAGFYATKDVAVCCTGNGEAFMRAAVAKDVDARMAYQGLSVTDAVSQAIANGERLIGSDFEGGIIAVDAEGRVAMEYNSKGCYRGSVTSQDPEHPKALVWRE